VPEGAAAPRQHDDINIGQCAAAARAKRDAEGKA